ncbi:unnamed protein product, partial [Prorocentrum cordatum]
GLHNLLLEAEENELNQGRGANPTLTDRFATSRVPGVGQSDGEENARRKLAARKELWRKMKRRTWLQGTLSSTGDSSRTEEEAAQALQDHWSSVFAATADDEPRWPELLQFVQKSPDVLEEVDVTYVIEHGWMMDEFDWRMMVM